MNWRTGLCAAFLFVVLGCWCCWLCPQCSEWPRSTPHSPTKLQGSGLCTFLLLQPQLGGAQVHLGGISGPSPAVHKGAVLARLC